MYQQELGLACPEDLFDIETVPHVAQTASQIYQSQAIRRLRRQHPRYSDYDISAPLRDSARRAGLQRVDLHGLRIVLRQLANVDSFRGDLSVGTTLISIPWIGHLRGSSCTSQIFQV